MLDKYNKINTPIELYNFINQNITYYQENLDKWKLNLNTELLNSKKGLCFDYVELEREWFLKHNYEIKTLFFIIALNEENPYHTHTCLLYKENNKWYHFEVSDESNKGIHEYNNINDAISEIKKELIEYNRKQNLIINQDIINKLKVYEYPKPLNNYSFNDYIEYLTNNKNIDIKEN